MNCLYLILLREHLPFRWCWSLKISGEDILSYGSLLGAACGIVPIHTYIRLRGVGLFHGLSRTQYKAVCYQQLLALHFANSRIRRCCISTEMLISRVSHRSATRRAAVGCMAPSLAGSPQVTSIPLAPRKAGHLRRLCPHGETARKRGRRALRISWMRRTSRSSGRVVSSWTKQMRWILVARPQRRHARRLRGRKSECVCPSFSVSGPDRAEARIDLGLSVPMLSGTVRASGVSVPAQICPRGSCGFHTARITSSSLSEKS